MATTLEKEVIKEICATGDKTNTIPETTQSGSNALSYADGFPIATSTPQSDNGIPPKRTDMNKVLNMLSKNQVFLQNGGAYSFDSSVSTAIGGYPKGARLLYTDIGGQKYTIESLKDNNISTPTSANIYSVTNLKKAEGIVEEISPDLPTATEDRLGQIYLAQAPVTSTKPAGTKAFVCQQGNNGYVWAQNNISSLFVDGDTIFVNDTKEYYGIINGVFVAIGYDGLNTYQWIYIPNIPKTFETVIRTWRSGYNWYRIWSDGFIEQGGRTDFDNSTITITYNIPFKSRENTLIVTKSRNGNNLTDTWTPSNNPVNIASYTTTGARVGTAADYGANVYCRWYACGY